jgi:putative endonuclease
MAGLSARRVRENALSDQSSGSKSKGKTPSPYFVYIVRCADGTLYTGSTNDIQARLLTHNSGRGAKYTAARRPVRVVYTEAHESRSAAQKREAQLKGWTRAKKEALLAGDRALLARL